MKQATAGNLAKPDELRPRLTSRASMRAHVDGAQITHTRFPHTRSDSCKDGARRDDRLSLIGLRRQVRWGVWIRLIVLAPVAAISLTAVLGSSPVARYGLLSFILLGASASSILRFTRACYRRLSPRQRLALARFLAFEVGIAVIPVLYASFGQYMTGLAAHGAPGDAARHGDLHLLASIADFVGITTLFFSPAADGERLGIRDMTVAKIGAVAAALFVGCVAAYSYGSLVSEHAVGTAVVWRAWLYWIFGVITGSMCIVVGEEKS